MEPIDKRPRVAEDAAEAIRRFIVDQQLSPGDMLPSEAANPAAVADQPRLGARGVAAPANDGAGRSASWQGPLCQRHNLQPMVDAYVNTIRLVDEDSFVHLLDVREALELGAADLAAKLRTPDDLERLESVLTAAERRVQTGGSALKEDLGFHDLLIKATHNPLLERLYPGIAPFLLEVRTRSAERAEREHLGSREDDWKVAIHDHTAIFRAFAIRTPRSPCG